MKFSTKRRHKKLRFKHTLSVCLLSLGLSATAQADLRITEIFSGQSGTKLTADWFELKNVGTTPWVSGVDSTLYYDDESMSASDADSITGIGTIAPGEFAIVIIGDAADVAQFKSVWGDVTSLDGLEIAYTDGAGLGASGDLVTLWMGKPQNTPHHTASYPATDLFDGKSYDVALDAFSEINNANAAIATLALGGAGSDVPNIASPGDRGILVIDQNAPVITVDVSANKRLKLNENSTSFITAAINDPSDAASTEGILLNLSDLDGNASDLIITASSSNEAVVTNNNLVLENVNDEQRKLKIIPSGIGYTTIEVTVQDLDGKTDSYSIEYAASAAAIDVNDARFYSGSSDGSTAIPTNDGYFWVGDDENQILRLYDADNSGAAVNEVNLVELGSAEVDIEGSFRKNDTIFWMGSQLESERATIFSVKETGSGENTTVELIESYKGLRADLMAWDANNEHGMGANHFGLSQPFDVEALSIDPNNDKGALIGFRSVAINGNGLVIPVNNFQALASSEVKPSAEFGTPILLDLERRTLRSLECNAHGCLIIAGPHDNTTEFRLFTWSGNADDQPELRSADLMSKINHGSYEGIVGLPTIDFLGTNGDAIEVELLIDMGTNDFYNDNTQAKDLPNNEWKKVQTQKLVLGEVIIPPVAYAGDVVITEIMQNPNAVGDGAGEWFELYNASSIAIDLNNWTFLDNGSNTHTIDNGGPLLIEPKSYMVFGINADESQNGGVHVDYQYNSNFALANGDDELILKASDGTTIDSIAYDGGPNWPDPAGISMALQNPRFENNDPNNWCEASTAYGAGDFGTPGTANDCTLPPSAELRITEIWCGNAVGDNLTADWFEITNLGDIAWVSGTNEDLFYDDESQDPNSATLIMGINSIDAGESVIVMIGNETDVIEFQTLWNGDYDLDGVEIGYTDGAGLGQGGDGVTLFEGEPSLETIKDVAAYPAISNGASFDIILNAISEMGVGSAQPGSNVAVATTTTNGAEPAIASPGNKGSLTTITYDLKITEIFSGQSGDKLTADWFEIVNNGNAPWTSVDFGPLVYDDESADPEDADTIIGIDELAPNASAIVIIGEEADLITFKTVWSEVIDLNKVSIGYTDGAGLGGGGDRVTLWVADPTLTPEDTASYPDTELNDGQSYDVLLGEFTMPANGGITTLAMGGEGDVPNVATPGNGLAISSFKGLRVTEIFPGQSGTKLTADWFEISNTSDQDWISGISPDLYYDDESADPLDATIIEGITIIKAGEAAVIMVGNADDKAEFITVWSDVYELNNVQIGYTDGAGLGGGGDIVTLWVGNPKQYAFSDTASYPDTDLNDGQTFDVTLGVFSEVGNANFALATLALGGADDTPNIGSPANLSPITSLNDAQTASLNVYPNPSTGSFTIQSSEHIQSLEIFNLTGNVVDVVVDANRKFNLSGFPEGIYLLKINTTSRTEIVRITKQ